MEFHRLVRGSWDCKERYVQQLTGLTLIPPLLFALKMLTAVYIHVHFMLYFFRETNNMNPDQTATMRGV